MSRKRWFPGWRQPELQLQLVPKEEPTMSRREPEPDPNLPCEEMVDHLREARRAGMFFQGRKYRTALAKLTEEWRRRNTPEFYVAATELAELVMRLKLDDQGLSEE